MYFSQENIVCIYLKTGYGVSIWEDDSLSVKMDKLCSEGWGNDVYFKEVIVFLPGLGYNVHFCEEHIVCLSEKWYSMLSWKEDMCIFVTRI